MKYLKTLYKHYHRMLLKVVDKREKYLTEQQFVLVLALLTGLGGAGAALILKYLIHTYQHLQTSTFGTDANYLYLLYPVVGILIAGLFVRYIAKDDIGHGVTKILYAISQRKSIIKRHNIFSSVAASSVTSQSNKSERRPRPFLCPGIANDILFCR